MPKSSPNFRTRYTDRQRAAVIAAQLEARTGPARAVAHLNAGRLEDAEGPIAAPMPPMPASTAADLARRARRRLERGKPSALTIESPAAARRTITRRAVALVNRELERLERKASGTKPSELVAMLKLAREANALLRAEEPPAEKSPPAPSTSSPTEEPEPSSLEDRIAEEERARKRSRGARRPPSHPPSHGQPHMHMHDASAQEAAANSGGARPPLSPSPDRVGAHLEPIPAAVGAPRGLPGALEPR